MTLNPVCGSIIMATKHRTLRPGRIGRMLLRVVLDKPVQPKREPLMPVCAEKSSRWLRIDAPVTRDQDILRA